MHQKYIYVCMYVCMYVYIYIICTMENVLPFSTLYSRPYIYIYVPYIYIYIESLGSKNCRVELRRNQKRTPATWFFIIIRGLQVHSLILLSDNSLFVIFIYSIGYNELSLVWPNPPSSRCRSQAPPSVTTDVYSYRRRLPHASADPRRIKEAWA